MTVAHLGEIVARRAAIDPDGPAVRSGDERLTWNQLDQRVRAAARVLRDRGVEAGDRVGVWLHKSVDSMVAVHAVLFVGAAVVPLDPGADPEQVAAVLDDADVAAVIAGVRAPRRAGLAALRPALPVVELPAPGAERPTPDGRGRTPDHDLPADRSGDDMAYLMYTSGSTGQPKGIVHTHASALAYARRAAEVYGLGPGDLCANIAPLHFDQSTFELYAAPLAGAEALFVPEPYLRLPASLAELVEAERPTVWYSVPSVLLLLLERGGLAGRDLSSLRWVLFGGEVMAPSALRRLMAHVPSAVFSNVYGPAEVNQCTHHDIVAPPAGDDPVPIGRAWAETDVAIVDGELLVRTDTAMAGYWRRPDATAAAFVVGPDGARDWYATGDLVDRRADGELVFVGRRDHQVKVRGQRVELEAVDVALAALPEVARAVAVVTPGVDGLATIVGLVEPVRPGAEPSRESIRSLRAVLPSHAVPVRVVTLDALPTTASGKVDRRASADRLRASSTLAPPGRDPSHSDPRPSNTAPPDRVAPMESTSCTT